MKLRILFLLLLIIILVSLNWFRVVVAQDLSDLTDEEKLRLFMQKRNTAGQKHEENYYRSPVTFEDLQKLQTPGGEVAIGGESIQNPGSGEAETGNDAFSSPLGVNQMPDFTELRPFGMDMFQGQHEIDPPTDIASADDYILGPGDNVIIYLWGRVEKEYNLTLDREGKVFVPKVGEIIGWGLTLEQFSQVARKRFSRVFSDFDLTVSLGRIRSIRIYVAGEVKRPGAYTVSSLTSLFNALYIAGGPNERGSMRNIKLMRKGKPAAVVDLYNLLLKGDNSTDTRLQTGDVIFVPVAGMRVAIRGEINRPAIYELKGGETVLDLLELAGKPTPLAYLDRVMLERISESDQWEVRDLNLNTKGDSAVDDIELVDGDRLTVFSIFDAKANLVVIQGHVKHPGYYERTDSTRVSDLIKCGQLRPYDVYYERADLFRRYPDRSIEVIPINLNRILAGDTAADLLLQDRDSLYVYSIDEIEREKYVYIEGEVKRPGKYPLYENMTVEDLIFLAGSFTRGAYRHQAEIARFDSLGNVSLLYLNLSDTSQQNRYLREDDHVYIRRIPEWQLDRTVVIEGEVNYPGIYTLCRRDETLYQLLQRAGGFTKNAFPKGIILKRESIGDNLLRLNVPELLARSQPIVKDSLGRLVKQEIFRFDYSLMNRVIIDMEKILATEGREGDVVLEPNDRIYVPSIPSGISVMGAVGANGTIKFVEGKTVKYYIEHAGNFTRQADKKGVRLIRAEGEVISGRGTLGKRVELGDVIIVPSKIEKERNWFKTFTTAITATTGLLTTVYVISKL
jgi:protein involved in polysaccharide export with SLBB domain